MSHLGAKQVYKMTNEIFTCTDKKNTNNTSFAEYLTEHFQPIIKYSLCEFRVGPLNGLQTLRYTEYRLQTQLKLHS